MDWHKSTPANQETAMHEERKNAFHPSRRDVIRIGAGAGAAVALPTLVGQAWADDAKPPIGTWPAGAQGDSVFIGISVPRTGTYALQGEDELKGYQLAI